MIDGALFEVELNSNSKSKSKGGKCRAILIDFASRLKISEQTDSVCVCGTVSVKSILTGSQISDRQVATTKNTRE